MKVVPVSVISVFFILSSSCRSQIEYADWPQWRGPERNGVWEVYLNLEQFGADNITEVWETAVGSGYCGPTVSGGRVYLMDYTKSPEPSERVQCFDAGTGKSLWSHEYPCEYFSVGYPTGPRASVLINDGMAYSFGTMGQLFCLDAATGTIIWHHNSVEEFYSQIPTWGLAVSPIIEEDLIIVQLGGQPDACIMAFNKYTGKEIWRALGDDASYSAPVIIEQSGQRVLVCWTGDNVAGLDPGTGEVYWKIPFTPNNMIMNVPSPVYAPPYLFLSGFFDGSLLIRLDQDELKAELVWHRFGESESKTDALHCCISTPVIEGEYVYGLDSYGEMRCLDLLTGDRIWEDNSLVPKGRWANVHFTRQEEKIWAFNELGDLILCRFTPEGVQEYGRVNLIKPVPLSPNPRGGVCWSHPAYAGYRIYVRNDEKLVCYSITE